MNEFRTFKDRLDRVQTTMAAACARAGRRIEHVTLIAVSKTHPASAVLAACEAGLRHFGENRIEEAALKIPQVTVPSADADLHWHMIGHVQSRKAKDVPPLFGVVHSVDTLKLATKLSEAIPTGQQRDIFIEVNVSGEASKSGFAATGWRDDAVVQRTLVEALQAIDRLPGLHIRGLMTMAPIVATMEETRPVFAGLRGLRDCLRSETGLPLLDLSMGMTDDYPVAIEEGATLIRVGRALFGERQIP